MTGKPFLDERRLPRALESQGFTLESIKSGTRVLAPDGHGTTVFHPSIFREDNVQGYRNFMSQLRRMGFDPQAVRVPRASAEDWKRERDALDAEYQATLDEAAAGQAVEAAEDEAARELSARIRSLAPKSREAYEAVVASPGHSVREYATALETEPHLLSQRLRSVRLAGLVEQTGATTSSRYWVAGQVGEAPLASKNGRPSAGPLRVRHIEPADPVIRFRKLAERANRLRGELTDVVGQMAEAYASQEAELNGLRRKLRDLEAAASRLVDRL